MEIEEPRIVYGFIGNFDVCFTMSSNKKLLTIQSMFRMSDNVYENHITQQQFPKQCMALFGDIETLFQYIQENVSNKQLIQVDDLCQLKIYLIVKTLKSQIKQKCQLPMKQVQDEQKKGNILLTFIRIIRKKVKPNPQIQKQNLKILSLQAENNKLREEISNFNSQNGGAKGFNNDIQKIKISEGFCAPSSKYGQKIHISIRKENPYLKFYSVNDDILVKTKQKNKWVNLFMDELIPKSGKYYFSFKIIHSLFNNIEIGILMTEYEMELGTISEKAISYHLADGVVRFGRQKKQGDQQGKEAPKNSKLVVITVVDMDEGLITWYCDDNLMAKAKITQYLMLRKICPFIGMCHVDDIIQLNLQ